MRGESGASIRMAASALPSEQRCGVGGKGAVDQGGIGLVDAVGFQQLVGDAPGAALARAGEDALALEVAQAGDRHVGAGEHPDRLVEHPPDRPELRVLLVAALGLLGGEPPLQAAHQAALDEGGVDAGPLLQQRPQRGEPLGTPLHLECHAIALQIAPVGLGQLVVL